jgi:hypothetical protein
MRIVDPLVERARKKHRSSRKNVRDAKYAEDRPLQRKERGLRSGSFGSDRGFFGKHDGDVVFDGVDAAAGAALEAGAVGERIDGSFADGADENVEEFFGNWHGVLRWE